MTSLRSISARSGWAMLLCVVLWHSSAVYAEGAAREPLSGDVVEQEPVAEDVDAAGNIEGSAADQKVEPAAEQVPIAENIDLRKVVIELPPPTSDSTDKTEPDELSGQDAKEETDSAEASVDEVEPEPSPATDVTELSDVSSDSTKTENSAAERTGTTDTDSADAAETQAPTEQPEAQVLPDSPQQETREPDATRTILGVKVLPATSTRLTWVPVESFGDLTAQTPVLVVNGRRPGKTLCLTAAVHGDELNGIEMIRRVVYDLDPEKLTGTVIGVPIVNIMAFRRNSRYLPDRRDLNRYFPGSQRGSAAARMAHSFFNQVVKHCDALVDLHTGSFYRTNLPQLRADLSDTGVLELSQSFGAIAVLNSKGHPGSLRAAAVREGIPAVTMEAGEPMRLQTDVVAEGTKAIDALMHKMGMYSRLSIWAKPTPAYYRSHWVRADQSGFLFSRVNLGRRVNKGEVLGTVTDPITNEHRDIVSPYRGRVLGMALDQLVLPGFAAYHIGIQAAETELRDEDPDDELYDEAGFDELSHSPEVGDY